MDELSDEQLMRRVIAGEAEEFGHIIVRYEGKMRRYARRFLRIRGDIDDVVQEVFIKAFENARSFDPEQKFSSWLYRIAHNAFLNHLRDSRRAVLDVDFDAVAPFLYSSEDVAQQAYEKGMLQRMDGCMASLDAKYREVLTLRFFEDLSYDEIADILKIPISTVGVRISRGLKAMRKGCEEKDN